MLDKYFSLTKNDISRYSSALFFFLFKIEDTDLSKRMKETREKRRCLTFDRADPFRTGEVSHGRRRARDAPSPRDLCQYDTFKPSPFLYNRWIGRNIAYEIFIGCSQTRATICKVTGFSKLHALGKQGDESGNLGTVPRTNIQKFYRFDNLEYLLLIEKFKDQ